MNAGLDNPFWASLAGPHRGIALRHGGVARYPADVAPFLGVASSSADISSDLDALVAPGEEVLALGVPPRVSGSWRLEPEEVLAQMTCETLNDVGDGPVIDPLDVRDRADVLALVALVYPHYFRPRTMQLGRYFGIHADGQLAAMIGERLATDTHTEMSAICTHPGFTGRGYASRLIAFLTRDTLARGRTPFLHVSYRNPHARHLYAQLGYRLRRDIPFWSVRCA